MSSEGNARVAPMQSPVNWALLGLVIERPSYAYELANRFERTYDSVLPISSTSHIYTALAALRERALVAEIPGTRDGRRPRACYEATERGLIDYGEWLIGQVGAERRREELVVLQLARFAGQPQMALTILDRYEQACLSHAQRIAVSPRPPGTPDTTAALSARLVAEESRLALAAKLEWVQYARTELNARVRALAGPQ
jgi:DNA-binding PadR family transcriptional regulator